MGDRFRGDYGELQKTASTFGKEAEAIGQMNKNIDSKMSTLKDGKQWVGKGADKFYGEMESAIKPALKKLYNALTEAARITQQIAQITKQAEDESSKIFIIVVQA